jgi:hypothetical protein
MPDDTREAPPHGEDADEPLGPLTPDDETPAGDTPEVHGDITPHDLPRGSEARKAAEEDVGKDGTTRGNT